MFGCTALCGSGGGWRAVQRDLTHATRSRYSGFALGIARCFQIRTSREQVSGFPVSAKTGEPARRCSQKQRAARPGSIQLWCTRHRNAFRCEPACLRRVERVSLTPPLVGPLHPLYRLPVPDTRNAT